jgi:multicomponent Na+:H+ antiporter subunit E
MSRAFTVLLLAGVYLLALASLDPLDVATAIVLGTVVLVTLHRILLTKEPVGAARPVEVESTGLFERIVRFPLFAAMVVWEITVGTWRVALVVAGVRELQRPGIVQIPIGERTPTGVATTALAITLSPGELLVDIDSERQVMLVHVIDARNPDAVRDHYARFYERYQRKVFP